MIEPKVVIKAKICQDCDDKLATHQVIVKRGDLPDAVIGEFCKDCATNIAEIMEYTLSEVNYGR